MADLTFTQVQSKLPAGSITLDSANSDVKISLKALMGETAVALNDAKVGELISKFLDACASAQTDYNANAANPKDLRSYNAPTASAPVRDTTTGAYSSTFNYTVSVQVPLDKNAAVAVEV